MKINKLNFKIKTLIAGLTLITFIACNSNDETANNSPATDSTANAAETPVVPPARVKRGRVAASIKEDDATVKIVKDKDGFYSRTEVSPAYPGGQTSLEDYISSKIEYPQQAIDNNTEGTVYVQFGVDDKGNVSNVSTVGKKIGDGLEEAAVKVVSAMPKWTPGQVKGKSVKTWRTLPIVYKLES
jgi:protein TonB